MLFFFIGKVEIFQKYLMLYHLIEDNEFVIDKVICRLNGTMKLAG